MSSQALRQKFLKFFKEQGHTIVPSSPVIPYDDPTLLFINAGMNQFKDVFLGQRLPEYTRATTTQKCIRVGGKHNDLENVGHTSRHLTFFEMLGNFSFGDYFKKEAIDFAWKVTCDVLELDPKKVFVSVFHEDEESFELWKRHLPENRIVRMGEKDNFWSMGDVGPCGPCSELLFDRGERFGHARNPAEDIEGERFLEFWNLVFMEFNRSANGDMTPLPKKCVDTGAGLERLVSLKMGVDTLYETDILRALIARVEQIAERPYEPEKSSAFRVIADHIRSLAFAIADGVVPSNIERGYVLRKVLRRAVRYGRQIGMENPFLACMLPNLIELMGDDFPELVAAQDRIAEILTVEEENFLRTLKRGGNLLNTVITKSEAAKQISGDDAFKLKDTYGLPLEEILLLAKDANLNVDLPRYEELEHEAKVRSRGAREEVGLEQATSDFEHFHQTHGPCEFLGYQQLTTDSVILGLLKDHQEVPVLHEGEEGIVLLSKTPFYAEQGGQVGDQGVLTSETASFEVLDCQQPYTDVIAHIGVIKKGELRIGEQISATVDITRRQKIANNHTATHLLHWALHQVLGEHVKQGGSVVEAHRLRFDFTHNKALSQAELEKIEDLVNQRIRENLPVQSYEMEYETAQKQSEIKQFFGEKYGATVRVIDMGFSKELCGGTHTSHVGNIGYFRILSESSISAGVRRIVATSGSDAEQTAREQDLLLSHLAATLKTQPGQLQTRFDALLEEQRKLTSELNQLKKGQLDTQMQQLQIETLGQIPLIATTLPFTGKELPLCAEKLFKLHPSLALILFSEQEGKCSFFVQVSPDLVTKGILANALIKEIAPLIQGKGGGKADRGQGGGTAPQEIPNAIAKARAWIAKHS